MIQKRKGSATAPTVPSHGSTNPRKEKEMNKAIDSTGAAEKEVARHLRDIVDLLASVRDLNEAIFMAAEHHSLTKSATGAIQIVSDALGNKLGVISDRLDEILEGV